MSALLLLLQLTSTTSDAYRTVAMSNLATTKWTHVCVVGPVVYTRLQRDGDIHITLDDGKTKVVLEIIPQIPLQRPKKGTTIRACGVSRFDRQHAWPEIHPVTSWRLQ